MDTGLRDNSGLSFAPFSDSHNLRELSRFSPLPDRNVPAGHWLWCGRVTGLFSAGLASQRKGGGKGGKGSLQAKAGLCTQALGLAPGALHLGSNLGSR